MAGPPLLPDPTQLLAYVAAVMAIAVTPGPGLFYVLARTLAGGRRAGIVSALGLVTGSALVCLTALACVVALIEVAPPAYALLRILGAGYMGWLAWRLLRARPADTSGVQPATSVDGWRIFGQGVVTSLLSPNSLLFYFVFIPQFTTHPPSQAPVQFALLGVICALLGNGINLGMSLALASFGVRNPSAAAQRRRNRISAAMLAAVGLFVLVRA